MEIIRNQKGGETLCYEGYTYTKKNQKTTSKRWECSHRSRYNCKGSLTTDLAVEEVKKQTEHCHDAHSIATDKVIRPHPPSPWYADAVACRLGGAASLRAAR